MRGMRIDWARSKEAIALDLDVAAHHLFGPDEEHKSRKYAAIGSCVGDRWKLISQATLAEILTKARLRLTDAELDFLIEGIKKQYLVMQTTDELCVAFSKIKRQAERSGHRNPEHHRVWTAAICQTTKIFVLALSKGDYLHLLPLSQVEEL